jgi:hypothetical protein
MSKKLRIEPINIAPEIMGWLDENNHPIVIDQRNNIHLDPNLIDDKIIIYKRQVNDWFLEPASNLARYRNKNNGFIVLMICCSYLEGVEQYRQGLLSNGRSRSFFVSAMQRMYPNKYNNPDLDAFYDEARCGLFHNGMVRGRIIIRNSYTESLEFTGSDIKISPTKFLVDVKNDFQSYLQDLQSNQQLRDNFDRMFSNM